MLVRLGQLAGASRLRVRWSSRAGSRGGSRSPPNQAWLRVLWRRVTGWLESGVVAVVPESRGCGGIVVACQCAAMVQSSQDVTWDQVTVCAVSVLGAFRGG
jgi:hypothetical protein